MKRRPFREILMLAEAMLLAALLTALILFGIGWGCGLFLWG